MSGETKISADIAKMIIAEFNDWLFMDRHQCGILRVGKRFIHCGQKGVADRIGFIKQGKYAGNFIGIEVKAADGKQSKEQIAFQSMVEAANCFYLLVDSVEDCRERIKQILGEQ
jgi:hypothetical protein